MGFQRRINKEEIPVCTIMNVNIAAINMDWLLNYTKKNIKNLSGDYICVANVHTTVMAYENANYRAIQNGGIMAIPDGGPLAAIGRKRGFSKMERVAGPSYMEEIFRISSIKKYRHYFYGSSKDTLNKMCKNVKRKYPDIQIVGMYSPPFRTITDEEDQLIVKQINDANADFVWIGLGAPKQEQWMAAHQGRVKGLMVGVGAGFDYLAGNIQRAPMWMQKNNLEWFYRLLQDPQRLFRRYWHTNFVFLWRAWLKGR